MRSAVGRSHGCACDGIGDGGSDVTAVAGVAFPVAVALLVIAFVGGVGITTVGPGGIFVTAALYALTDVPPATVAGTASATFVATGILGAGTYLRSGELGDREGSIAAAILSLGGVIGALVGVGLNAVISERLFGYLLGGMLFLSGILVWWRTRDAAVERHGLDLTTWRGGSVVLLIGFTVGIPGGLLGVGGPVLAVPLLVMAGVPMLLGVGLAQVQSIWLATGATAGYIFRDAVSWPLVVLVGVPELVGVVAGWYVAHRIDPRQLKRILAVLLVVLGPYIGLS